MMSYLQQLMWRGRETASGPSFGDMDSPQPFLLLFNWTLGMTLPCGPTPEVSLCFPEGVHLWLRPPA